MRKEVQLIPNFLIGKYSGAVWMYDAQNGKRRGNDVAVASFASLRLLNLVSFVALVVVLVAAHCLRRVCRCCSWGGVH